ncbi:MAG: PAQR family membrane homeostasis protein TrhA [Nanobdellota archaeon]
MKNEPGSSLTHLMGFFLAITALVLLIVFAAINRGAIEVVSVTIFGASMILLYAASALFHFIPRGTITKEVFRRIDHSMIYILIAGTYTPICLSVVRGALGWTLFGVIWGLALLGVIIKSTGIRIKEYISTTGYVLMGWLAIFSIKPVFLETGALGIFWLTTGGVLYTIGALIYFIDFRNPKYKVFGAHEIFHLLVIGGSFCHFWFILSTLQ